jgi:hypothetical protein
MGGKRIDVGCFYFSAIAAEIRKSHVINHDEKDVWTLTG